MQKSRISLRFCFAYLALSVLVAEFLLFLSLPYTQSGFRIITLDSCFTVSNISKGSPAWDAGIRKGDSFLEINGTSIEMANAPMSKESVYQLYSSFYAYDTLITMVKTDGSEVQLIIPSDVSIWKKCANACSNNLITFLVGFLFIVLAILCRPFFSYSPDAGSCISFLYSCGICIVNKLAYVSNPVWYSNLNLVLYEISACSIATSTLYSVRHFLRISSASHRSIRIHTLATLIPRVFLVFTLVTHYFSPVSIYDSVLYHCCEGLLIISLLYMAFAFLWLLRHIPRQSSILLRFFLLALIFCILPLVVYQAQHFKANMEWVVASQSFYEAVPLLFAPIAVLCAFIQSKTFSFDVYSGRIMNIWCCFISELLILLLLNPGLTSSSNVFIGLLIFTPLVFVLLENSLYAFLFPVIEKREENLQLLENKVFLSTDSQAIFSETAEWIRMVLQPSCICFYRILKNEPPLQLYQLGSGNAESDERMMKCMLDDRLRHPKKKDRVINHLAYGFSVPLYRGHDLYGYLCIGNRTVQEPYRIPGSFSTSEVRLIQDVARILMEAVMMSDMRQSRKRSYELSESNDELTREIGTKERQILRLQDKTVLGMAVMVESRDNSTGGHIKRTCAAVHVFSDRLLEQPWCTKNRDWFDMVVRAAILHDLGKIAVDDRILRKEGPFTPEEYAEMKKHTLEGARVVETVLEDVENDEFKQIAVNIAHYHHEKWDGTGYPEGLIGPEIPLEARIMAFADVFDALVSKRCYKDAFSFDRAYSIIENDLGSHFDPVLGKVFLECIPLLKNLYAAK
ncbi:MAG: HD domain-containing protein [Treponemataceae bacterium]|nr:HD domain-containing protein [Treponemataceae bacterium]